MDPQTVEKSTSGWVWEGLGAVFVAIWGHLGSKLRLEADLAIFGRPWKGQDGAKRGPKGAKRSQVGTKLAGSCGQEAPRSTQEGLLGAMLGAPWPIWGAFWGHLAEKAAKQKTKKTEGFLRFWLLWGCPGEGLEASWRSCWPMLASSSASMLHFRAMLGHLGAKMANKMGKMAAKSAKMSQDGPTWTEKAIEGCLRKAPTGPESGLRRPPRRAFSKGKDQRVRQDLQKTLERI